MNTNENKGLIWDLLKSHGHFSKINGSYFNQIQNEFDNLVLSIEKSNPNKTVIELNKILLSSFIQNLQKYKIKNTSVINSTPINKEVSKEKILQEDIQNERLEEFNKELNKKQDDFNNFMKKEVPEEIDFSDKKEEETIENPTELINSMVSSRENQLSSILLNQPPPPLESKNENETKNEIETKNETKNETKKSKEKKGKQTKLLEQILNNQTIIINLLKNKV